jgi:hypothetical protein
VLGAGAAGEALLLADEPSPAVSSPPPAQPPAPPGHGDGSDDGGQPLALFSASPAPARHYYCTELLAAAYMRMHLIPAPGSAPDSQQQGGKPARRGRADSATDQAPLLAGGADTADAGALASGATGASAASAVHAAPTAAPAQGVGLTDAASYWPNAWVLGGVVDALLPPGCRLSPDTLLDCRILPLQQAVRRGHL